MLKHKPNFELMSNSGDFALEILVKRLVSSVCLGLCQRCTDCFRLHSNPESSALIFLSSNKGLVCDREEGGAKIWGIKPWGKII